MNKLLKKLSSRKLWAAISGLIVGIAAAFGIEENDYAQIAGIVTSAISVVAYIFGEAEIDAAYAKSATQISNNPDVKAE